MKDGRLLTITSLLLIVLLLFHLSDDIVRGYEKGGLSILMALPVLSVWLFGALVLRERRSGYIITLLGSLLSLAIPYFHMKGKGLGYQIEKMPSGGLFFAWTVLTLGVVGIFSVALSARGLWRLWRRPAD
jgi:hypothetical protein